jgi:hypothetical protein
MGTHTSSATVIQVCVATLLDEVETWNPQHMIGSPWAVLVGLKRGYCRPQQVHRTTHGQKVQWVYVTNANSCW